jgi:tetratricopeptide (TPR) repeat protein
MSTTTGHASGSGGSAEPFLSRFETWIRGEDERAEPVAAAVAALDFTPSAPDTLAQMYPAAKTIGVARRLTAKSHSLVKSAPPKAAALALLAARVAESATCPRDFVAGLDTARGDAWMRYAAAVFELGNFQRAWKASQRADTYFQLASPFPPAFRSETTLGLIQGKILHFLGDTEGGLLRIEQSAHLIRSVFQESAKYVEAMTIYNAILMRAGRFEEAARGWQEIADLARNEGNSATLAYIVNNVGRCYLQLNEMPRAQECFETALEMCDDFGLKTEIPDVRLNRAFALRQTGLYAEAILEMERCRDEFASFGMMFEAAHVCIRIIETRLLTRSRSDLSPMCEQAVDFLRAAGLTEQWQRAADYLLDAPRKGTLSVGGLREVYNLLTRLSDSPASTAAAPRSTRRSRTSLRGRHSHHSWRK